MSAPQPAAPEPHEPQLPVVPGDEPLRAMAEADDVVWYIPEPEVPEAEVLPPSTEPEQRKFEMQPTPASPTPTTPAKPRAPKPAAKKPTAGKGPTAGNPASGARKPAATAKPAAAKATPAKPRAPRRKATAWPTPAPQVVPGAATAEQTPTFVPATVPDPAPSAAPLPHPDPDFVPQRPSIERREHVREPEHSAPAFRSPPPAPEQATPTAPFMPPAPVQQAAPSAPAPQVAPAPSPAPSPVPAVGSAAPPTTHREAILAEAASKAPPGFTGVAIHAAESPSLLALDPTFDESGRPYATPDKDLDTVAGSAILGALKNMVPRTGDHKHFGRDKGATVRVSLATIAAAAVLVGIGPAIGGALTKLPLVGSMFGQIKAFTLYPSAYGVAGIASMLGLVSVTGMVVAQMERTANKIGRRHEPNTRLNIGLAALIALIFTAGMFSMMKAHGWAASAAAVGFFAATCLLVPLGNTPGARALRHLPSRAWAGAFVLSVIALVIYPSLPGALITLLSFTHVRTNWRAISDGDDEGATGPIESTERKSAALITAFALIAAAVGMHAMTLTPAEVRKATNQNPPILGVFQGDDIAPPKTP